jgi:PiT family inorganic phosphate transporter
VRWGVAKEIVMAWVVTIPASALIAAFFYRMAAYFGS